MKLIISVFCGSLCLISCAQNRNIDKAEAVSVDISFIDNPECSYDRWDSTLLVFRSGSNGLLEIIRDSIPLHRKNIKVNRNEGISDIVKVSRDTSAIVVKLNEKRALIDVKPNYGIIYFDRMDLNTWLITYDNCFYPARK